MLQPNLKFVKPLENYKLLLEYENGEVRIFAVEPYISGEWYGELRDVKIFNTVKVVDNWTVEWQGGQDISPQELYNNSILMNIEEMNNE